MAIDQTQMQEYAKQWGQLVARAWSDEAFKARLLTEPGQALAEAGIAVPAGYAIQVHENSENVVHLTLPAKPSEELSDEQLDAVAGGATGGSVGTAGSFGCLSTCASSVGTVGTAGSFA